MHPDSHRFESHNSLIIQRRSKRKKISTLLRYRFSFDGSWLAPRYPDISCGAWPDSFVKGIQSSEFFSYFLPRRINYQRIILRFLPMRHWTGRGNWKSPTKRLDFIESLWRSNDFESTLFTIYFFLVYHIQFFSSRKDNFANNWNVRIVSNDSRRIDPSGSFDRFFEIGSFSSAFQYQLCRVFLGPVYTCPYRAAGTRTYKKTDAHAEGRIYSRHSLVHLSSEMDFLISINLSIRCWIETPRGLSLSLKIFVLSLVMRCTFAVRCLLSILDFSANVCRKIAECHVFRGYWKQRGPMVAST